jgi:hypothetical protein
LLCHLGNDAGLGYWLKTTGIDANKCALANASFAVVTISG